MMVGGPGSDHVSLLSLKDLNVTGRLDEIQTPTLILAGRNDFIFPPEHQALIADRLPNARLEIIEKAGHSASE